MKDAVVNYYEECAIDNAKVELLKLIQRFYQCDVEEISSFGDTLAHWKNEIVNSFYIVGHTYKVDKDTGEVTSKAKKNE